MRARTSCRPAIIDHARKARKARKRYLWPRSTPITWSRCGKSNSMVRSPPRPRPRVGRSRPSASRSKSWRHSAVRLWCNAPRMAWNSPPPVRCSPATARPSPIGWSGRPVKSRIIGIIGLITCIWWPTVNLLYYRGPYRGQAQYVHGHRAEPDSDGAAGGDRSDFPRQGRCRRPLLPVQQHPELPAHRRTI